MSHTNEDSFLSLIYSRSSFYLANVGMCCIPNSSLSCYATSSAIIAIPVVLLKQVQITVFGFFADKVIWKTSHKEKCNSQGFEEKTPTANISQHSHPAHEWPK